MGVIRRRSRTVVEKARVETLTGRLMSLRAKFAHCIFRSDYDDDDDDRDHLDPDSLSCIHHLVLQGICILDIVDALLQPLYHRFHTSMDQLLSLQNGSLYAHPPT